jgi:hypothetical protein
LAQFVEFGFELCGFVACTVSFPPDSKKTCPVGVDAKPLVKVRHLYPIGVEIGAEAAF